MFFIINVLVQISIFSHYQHASWIFTAIKINCRDITDILVSLLTENPDLWSLFLSIVPRYPKNPISRWSNYFVVTTERGPAFRQKFDSTNSPDQNFAPILSFGLGRLNNLCIYTSTNRS